MKKKTCKICKCKFTPIRQLQPTCTNFDCMQKYAELHLSKKKKENVKVARKAKRDFNNNDKKYLKNLAQKLCNKYARERDLKENGKRCVTCGITTGKMDGGHFLPTSGYSAIRYNTNQIHQQCVKCNRYNGGMYKEYRLFMINKYGEDYVTSLEKTKNVLRSYDVKYYQKLIRVVRKKIKSLS